MATELAHRREIPTPTPQHDKSLSPRGLSDHRRAIAFEVKAVLSAYFQPHEADEIKAAQLAWWCDELQEWTQEQVVWALRDWNRRNPRLRPTPGDILGIMKAARGRKYAQKVERQHHSQPGQRVTKEAASEIMAKAGYAPKTFGGEDA